MSEKLILGRNRCIVNENYAKDIKEASLEYVLCKTWLTYKGYRIDDCPACHSAIVVSGSGNQSYTCPVCGLKLSYLEQGNAN